MLTCAHPGLAWLLGLPLLVRLCWPPRPVGQVAIRVPFATRLQAAGARPAKSEATSRLVLPSILWMLIVVALMRPQWLDSPIDRTIPTRDLLLLVDLSASMGHADFTAADGAHVDRLTALKEVMGDFLTQREGDRVGLVVFGNAPFLQVPFTTDLQLCRQLLNETQVGMAGPRTALGDALGLGIQLLRNSDVPHKVMIAVTDGNDTSSGVPPVEAARIARDDAITIYTIAMGDPTTVGEEKLDVDSLKQVAQQTGGRFSLAMNREELTEVYAQLDQLETRDAEVVSHRPRRDLYYWPIAVMLFISLFAYGPRWKLSVPEHQATGMTRLRVNARTFELEAVE